MSKFLDLAPALDADLPTVTLNGRPFQVYGISAGGLAHLIRRFPALLAMLAGGTLTQDQILGIAEDALGAFVAAGIGYAGDDGAEAAANRLPLEQGIDALRLVLAATFPNGVAGLIGRIEALVAALGVEAAPVAAGPTS